MKKNVQLDGISIVSRLSFPVNKSTLGVEEKKPKDNFIALKHLESQSVEKPTRFMFRSLH